MTARPGQKKPFDRHAFAVGLAGRKKGAFRDEFFSALRKGDNGRLFVRRFLWQAMRGLIRGTIRRSGGSASVAAGALWGGSVVFEEHWLKPLDSDSLDALREKLILSDWLLEETRNASQLEDQDDRMLMTDIHLASQRLVKVLRSRLGGANVIQAHSKTKRNDPYGGRLLFDVEPVAEQPRTEA